MSSQQRRLEVMVSEGEDDPTHVNGPTGVIEAAAGAGAALLARLHGFDRDNQPLIYGVHGLPTEVLAARSTLPLRFDQIGSTVVVLLEHGDVRRPIIVGALVETHRTTPDPIATPEPRPEAEKDRVVISADREIVLRCGEATITLTQAGKVLIQGAYVSSRSFGVNPIKGGSVQIN